MSQDILLWTRGPKFFVFIIATIVFIGVGLASQTKAATYQLFGKVGDSSGNGIVGATIEVAYAGTSTVVASVTSDGLGNYITFIDGGTYDVHVTQPAGGNYGSAVALNQTISSDKIINFILVVADSATLSDHIYDPLGNPLSNVHLYLIGNNGSGAVSQVYTDLSGGYSLAVSAATDYRFLVYGSGLGTSFTFATNDFSLTQSTVLDITLPLKRVVIHVQDTAGNPLSGMVVETKITSRVINRALYIGGGVSVYLSDVWTQQTTNSAGDANLWLFPTDYPDNPSYSYIMGVTPPGGSIYAPFTLSPVYVTGDETEIISLQFIHNQPVTVINLSPAPDSNGNYSDPTTVSLFATAASGFTIANTYYTLDGGSQQTYTAPFEVSGDGDHAVTYWSIDNVGVPEVPNSTTFTILANLPPVITPISDTTINEGDSYIANGSFSDSTSTNWTAIVDYGEGDGLETLNLSATSFILSHTYKDNGAYIVSVEITDNQGLVSTETATITINNVNPSVGAIVASLDPIPLNTSFSASVSFTDPGVLDTYTATWNWGDGNTTAGTVTEVTGSGSVSDSHIYTIPGVYEVLVTVTDKDSGVGQSLFQYVVVYDNTATSGFVTGAGTINSPAGAYVANPSLTGIARFGFVSKYQNGATVPDGNTQFRFQAAGLVFQSTVYDWLVVAGAQAKYKGTGTIGGVGNYGFQLSGTDGAVSGGVGIDKFRIKIWDKDNNDTVVYDNQLGAPDTADPTTAINGGNIVIHH